MIDKGRSEWRWVALTILALAVTSSLPYLVAWAVTPAGARFTGLVFNPQDGNSYIAKMRQGLEGSWAFHLPYTPEPHDGAPVYLFYLFLGHAVRWTGLPLIVVYHLARLVGGAAMLLAIYALARRMSGDVRDPLDSTQGEPFGSEPPVRAQGERRAMFLLTALGAGVGWLVVFFGYESSDLWVPEAFPVYALLANAHFPLAMGLMIGVAGCGLRIVNRGSQREWLWGLGMVGAAVPLGAIQPFGLVAVFGALGVMLVARMVRERVVPWRAVLWIAITGALALPYPVYMLAALRADPVLAAWNAQNVTDSPPLWDWVLSYGLVLVLAVLGIVSAVRRGSDADWLLLGWVGVTVVGMYLPLPPRLQLQRRLSLGLGVPLGLLAGMGWWRAVRPRIRPHRRGVMQGMVVAFCALTPVFLALMAMLAAPSGGGGWFYLSRGEWAALGWLRQEGDADAVVLCSPQMGAFVPAWAGQPVVYGHPFETVDAERRKAEVEAYWDGGMGAAGVEAFLQENRVGYVFVGPREWALRGSVQDSEMAGRLVFEAGDVKIYDVR